MTLNEKQLLDDKWSNIVKDYPNTRNECFLMLYEACKNIAKALCKGIRNTHLEEDALDATMYCIYCMDKLEHKPEKLSSYCYLRVKKFLYSPSRIREDREVSLNELIEKQYFEEQQFEEGV